MWGHAAIVAWSNLILDRGLIWLQPPAACATRAGGGFDTNFESYCDLFHAQSPDTGRGAHTIRGGPTGTSMSISSVSLSDER